MLKIKIQSYTNNKVGFFYISKGDFCMEMNNIFYA